MKVLPSVTTNPAGKERIMELVRWGIYTCCFVGMILHLNEHENVLYEVQKGLHRDIVFIFFFVLLFTLQKIKLFNIASAVVSIVFVPIAVFNIRSYAASPELLRNAVLDMIVYWMAFMLITDMAVTKRVRSLRDLNIPMFTFLCVLTAFLLINREGRSVPVFYLYGILLCLIPADKEEWNRVLDALLIAGLIAFIVVMGMSLVANPVQNAILSGTRWYGSFMVLGTFGQFLGLETVLAAIMLFRIKSRFKKNVVLYIICSLWLLATFTAAFLCGTLDYALGLVFFLVTVFVFGFGRTEYPWLIIRALIALSLLFLAGIVILDFIPVVISPDYDTETLRQAIRNTPLGLFPASADELVAKIQKLHEYRLSNYNFVSLDAAMQNNPLAVFLNMIGSGRLSIWQTFLKNTSFAPAGAGLDVGTYFALHAHSEYIQLLYEYGFFTGGLAILFYLCGFVVSVVRYVKEKNKRFLFPLAILPMMFGMWVGEISTVYFSLTGIAFICMMTVVMSAPVSGSKSRLRTEEDSSFAMHGEENV